MPETKSRPKRKSAKPRSAPPPLLPREPADAELAEYSEAQIGRLVRLPSRLIDALKRAGQIHPTESDRGLRFSYEDSLVLRAAGALRASRIPASRIIDTLDRLRKALPAASSLSVLAAHHESNLPAADTASPPVLDPSGVAKEGDSERPGALLPMQRGTAERRREAEELFEKAVALEESDLDAARTSYLAALKAHGGHLEARINLGRLLHLTGELDQAERIYREAKHASALLSFNLAILLEDLNREEEAIAAYREALALDPSLHDAHFNLSRLHEKAASPREALRHLLAYHRQTRTKRGS